MPEKAEVFPDSAILDAAPQILKNYYWIWAQNP